MKTYSCALCQSLYSFGWFPLFVRVCIRSTTFQDIAEIAERTIEHKTRSKCFPHMLLPNPHSNPVTWVLWGSDTLIGAELDSGIPLDISTPTLETPSFSVSGDDGLATTPKSGPEPSPWQCAPSCFCEHWCTSLSSHWSSSSKLRIISVHTKLSLPHRIPGGWCGKAKSSSKELPRRSPQHRLIRLYKEAHFTEECE